MEGQRQELVPQVAARPGWLQGEAGVSRAGRREQCGSEARWKEERGLLLDTAARLRGQLREALRAQEGAGQEDQPD